MLVRRATAIAMSAVAMVMLGITPAWAANYPPGGTEGTGVGGVKTGADSGSGLPHTGFDFAVLWVGLGVLLLGVILLATARRRGSEPSA